MWRTKITFSQFRSQLFYVAESFAGCRVVAPCRTASAEAWFLTLLMMESVHLCSNFFPGNRLDLACIELSEAPLDLIGPSGFDAVFRFVPKVCGDHR
jgi:hypothetical protein